MSCQRIDPLVYRALPLVGLAPYNPVARVWAAFRPLLLNRDLLSRALFPVTLESPTAVGTPVIS